MTLDGAKRALRGDRSSAPEGGADMELLDRLHTLRSMLVAVRDSLTDDAPTTDVAEEPKAETVEVVAQSAPEQPQRPIYKEQTLFDF